MDINKVKVAEDEIVKRIIKEKPNHSDTRKIIIEEVERQGALINHFLLDLERLIAKFQDFKRRSSKLKSMAVEDKIGLQVKEALREVEDFFIHIDKIEDMRNKTNRVKKELEEIMNKYGKSTILTEEAIKRSQNSYKEKQK